VAASSHSAAFSAAGYLHQLQVGLLVLWDVAARPASAVRVEALDDIDILEGDAAASVVQVKHQLGDAAMTDRSPALWRSLTVWMDLVNTLEQAPLPLLMLWTTAHCAPGTGVEALRDDGAVRDEGAALDRLRAVAADTGNAETHSARTRFLALSDCEVAALLQRVRIVDATSRVTDFDAQLRARIGVAAPDPQTLDEFADRLTTWWLRRVAFMLADQVDRVTGTELWAYVSDLRDRMGRGPLITDADVMGASPEELEALSLRQSTFVRQIQLVADSDALFDLAVSDFWRAGRQRGAWQREGQLSEEEVDAFDRRLTDEWHRAHAFMHARLAATSAGDDARRAAGLAHLDECMQLGTVRLRGDFHEPVITRGSLHGLADRRHVGWHPDFDRLLDP
jgi:hypothetical protein